MKAVLQRVTSASVTVDRQLISSIGRGILVFAAVGKEDTEADVDSLAEKVLKVKLWPGENNGPWKRNVRDIQGEILLVSQFTLMGQVRKDHRFDFHRAADVESARKLYDYFYHRVQGLYDAERVKNGVFQAMMEVELKNDGPVTIEIDTSLLKFGKATAETSRSGKGEEKDKEEQSESTSGT